MFGIGSYRQRLYVQQEKRVADSGGGNVLSWVTINTVWASIEELQGTENQQAGKVSGNATHRIRMRYDGNITTDMRLVMGARVFNIRSIKNVQERDRALEILAQEGVAV